MTTKSKTKNVVSMKKTDAANTEDIAAQIEILKQDIALLAETVKTQVTETAKTKAEQVKDIAGEKTTQVKSQYEDITKQAEQSIRENPLSSIAIAVGAGLFLGLLTRR